MRRYLKLLQKKHGLANKSLQQLVAGSMGQCRIGLHAHRLVKWRHDPGTPQADGVGMRKIVVACPP